MHSDCFISPFCPPPCIQSTRIQLALLCPDSSCFPIVPCSTQSQASVQSMQPKLCPSLHTDDTPFFPPNLEVEGTCFHASYPHGLLSHCPFPPCWPAPQADFAASSASYPSLPQFSTTISELHSSQNPVSNLIQTMPAPSLNPQGNCRAWVTKAQEFIILYSLLLHILGNFHNEKFKKAKF